MDELYRAPQQAQARRDRIAVSLMQHGHAPVVVLEQCKNDLSRANIVAQAADPKGVSLSMRPWRR